MSLEVLHRGQTSRDGEDAGKDSGEGDQRVEVSSRRRSGGVYEEREKGDIAESDVAAGLGDAVVDKSRRDASRHVHIECCPERLKDLPCQIRRRMSTQGGCGSFQWLSSTHCRSPNSRVRPAAQQILAVHVPGAAEDLGRPCPPREGHFRRLEGHAVLIGPVLGGAIVGRRVFVFHRGFGNWRERCSDGSKQ